MGLASFLSARLVTVEPPETMFIKAGGVHCFSKTRACRGSAFLSFRLSRISNCLPYDLTISCVRLVHSEAQELSLWSASVRSVALIVTLKQSFSNGLFKSVRQTSLRPASPRSETGRAVPNLSYDELLNPQIFADG